jgi:hypothetical protein
MGGFLVARIAEHRTVVVERVPVALCSCVSGHRPNPKDYPTIKLSVRNRPATIKGVQTNSETYDCAGDANEVAPGIARLAGSRFAKPSQKCAGLLFN